MTSEANLGTTGPDFIHALFFVLKDMPNNLPANISKVLDAIKCILLVTAMGLP